MSALAEWGAGWAAAGFSLAVLAWVIHRLTWLIDRHWAQEPEQVDSSEEQQP